MGFKHKGFHFVSEGCSLTTGFGAVRVGDLVNKGSVSPPAWIKRLQISFTLAVTSGLILLFSPSIDVNLKEPAESC